MKDNLTIALRSMPVILNNISYQFFKNNIYGSDFDDRYINEKWKLLQSNPLQWVAESDDDKLIVVSKMVESDKSNFFMSKFNWQSK